MSNNDSSIAKLSSTIQKGIVNALKELHTSLPGIIENFDSVTQTATVAPAIKRVIINRGVEEISLTSIGITPLINVPVIYPRGGGFSLTFPVKRGDECLITFIERGLDNWHQRGGVQEPAGKRYHSYSDAVATVGLSSLPNVISDYNADSVQLRSDTNEVSITLDSANDVTIDCANLIVNGDSTFNGNVLVNGDITYTGTLIGPNAELDNVISDSNVVGGVEMAGHDHGPGTYQAGSTSVTGDSGEAK